MIGAGILGISAIIFVIGLILVVWDWVVRSEPDAPHGGPIVAIAIVGMLCGGMVACGETIKDVQELKKSREKTSLTSQQPSEG